jgi:hypothetical protein
MDRTNEDQAANHATRRSFVAQTSAIAAGLTLAGKCFHVQAETGPPGADLFNSHRRNAEFSHLRSVSDWATPGAGCG